MLSTIVIVYTIGGIFMAKKICKACGKEFEGKGTSAYCPGPHYSTCEVCGKQFDNNPRNPSRTCSGKCKGQLAMRAKLQKISKCEYCGKEYHMKNSSSRYCDGPHYTKCVVCGKDFEFTCSPNEKPSTCSKECRSELRRQTSLEKYGVDNPAKSNEVRQKISEIASSPEMVERRKQTSLIHWGVENPAQADEVKKKISQTVASKDCQSRMRSTTMERFGTPFAMQSKEGLKRYSESCIEKYGVPYYCMTTECRESQGDIISSFNRKFGELLKSVDMQYSFEFKLEESSYDLHIIHTNILIEINPTYTHNAIGNHWNKEGLPKKYHIEKSKLAEKHGYRCIHIFDWEDMNKIVNMLNVTETLYARKCYFREIDVKTACEFEDKYHIQGKCNGQKICYGLYYKGELIEVMTFGKPRYNRKYDWELLRLCTKSGVRVVGGASKLFKHFIDSHPGESIISYCDLSKFNGDVYEKIGMTLHHTTEPAKIWSRGVERVTNNLLLQRGYDQLFNASYGKGTSNEELMLNDGWLPIYDCGQAVYEWRLLS